MTFNPSDDGTYGYAAYNNGPILFAAAEQSDGKIILAGNVTEYNGTTGINNILRINPDGSIDNTFMSGTGATNTGFNGFMVRGMSTLPSGKIVITGAFLSYNGVPAKNIAVLNQDGSLDTSFSSGTGASGLNKSLPLSDGKMIVYGGFSNYNNLASHHIARINADGTLDTTFSIGTGTTNGNIDSVVALPDGKLIVAGRFTLFNGSAFNRIVRLNSDGSIDTAFNPGTGANSYILNVVLQEDGKLIISGEFATYNGMSRTGMARLNSDGSLDTAFNPLAGTNAIRSVRIDSEGKIVVVGAFSTFAGGIKRRVVRLNTDGTMDNTFVSLGADSDINDFVLLANGNILFVGDFHHYDAFYTNCLAVATPNGAADVNFNPAKGLNLLPRKIKVLADGTIYASGGFSRYNDLRRFGIIKLNTDGSADLTFNSSTNPLAGSDITTTILDFEVQPDGKVIVIGMGNGLARLNTDATIDTTYNPGGSGPNYGLNCLQLLPDGKLLLGGFFTQYNGINKRGVARLNSDGTLDTTFTFPASFYSATIMSLTIQSDGKILASGIIKPIQNSDLTYGLIRLNTDGSLDTSFTPVTAQPLYNSDVLLLPDGKMIFHGDMTSMNNTTVGGYARFNADGTLDSTFTLLPGTLSGPATKMLLLPDGKILMANGRKICLLNSDGTLDSILNPLQSMTSNFYVSTMALQPDSRVMIGGSFTTYNGPGVRNILRIYTTDVPTVQITSIPAGPYCAGATLNAEYTATGAFGPENVFTIELSDATGSFANPIAIGTVTSGSSGNITVTIPATTIEGTGYRIRITGSGPVTVSADNGIDITIYNTSAPVALPQSFCSGATVAELNAQGENLNWYSAINEDALTETTVLASGIYYVTQTLNGCQSPATQVAVTINEVVPPTGNMEQTVAENTTLANLEVEGENLIWYSSEDAALAAEDALPENTVAQDDTTYYVTQTVGECTGNPFAVTVSVILGTPDFDKAAIRYYPNPVTNALFISSDQNIESVSVFNLLGQQVLSSEYNNQEATIDTSALAAGSYIVKLTVSSAQKTISIIKQ